MSSRFTCHVEDSCVVNPKQSNLISRWFTKYSRSFIYTLLACLSFIQPSKTFSQTVQAWGDAPPAAWTASTLNNARSDYFQGEVIPMVYSFPSTGLVNGSSYTFTIKYDFYKSTGNAGGYAFMTTYNLSRDPDESVIGPNPTLDNTVTSANVGKFYTVNADITSAEFLADAVSGSTVSKVVEVTFTFTGTPGDDVIVYFGMFLSKEGSVPDQGSGATEGASHWPGGSLMVTITGTGGGGNVGNNPGAGGVVEGVISGVKYADADQSGDKNGSESTLPGWTIYLDLNNNDVFDGVDVQMVTAGDGSYSFGDLLSGTYTVREINQAGWTQTEPGGPDFEYSITIDAANASHPDKNFGNFECPTNGGTAAAAVSPICAGSSTTISLTGQVGNIVKWQYSTDGSTWNDIASTANPLNTGVLAVTTQFRAVVQSGACDAQNSSAATVVVDATTVGGSAAAAVSPICSGSSTTVSLTGNTGAIVKWQYSTDGSTWNDIASTANPLNTGVLAMTTQFRAVVQNGACSSQNSSAATVVVSPTTVGGSAAATTSPICAFSSTTVTLTGQTGAIVKWQYSTDGSTWNDIASTSNPLNTGILVLTTQFRAVVQSGACSSENSSAATVVVNATTVGGSAAATTSPICSGSSTNITLSGNTGSIVKWQYSTDGSTWNDIASTANPLNTGALTTTTQFRAVVQSGVCSSQNSSAATVTVTQPIIVNSFSGDQTVTYPANAVFSVNASNVAGYQWQEKSTAMGSVFVNLGSETGSSLTLTSPPVSKSGYMYRVNMTANSPCPDMYRTATLTVNPASLCLSYDGLTFGVTNTSGCYVANTGFGAGVIRLILSVVGSPAGDLSTAVVKVSIAGVFSNITATFVPASGGNPAYYYYDWSVPCLSNTVNSNTYELTWTIGGNYTTGTCNETNALITISRPSLDFTTGGGYILNNKSKGTIGIAPGETPSKNNYGFNVKWANNFKNLQGNFNTIIRQGSMQYQVKTNKPTYLTTNALPPYVLDNKTYYPYEAIMVFENAVYKNLTLGTSQGGGPQSVVYLRVVDNGEPNSAGTPRIDSISILYKLNNTVIYSSEQYSIINNPAVIKLMAIVKGNIQVHVNGGPNNSAAPSIVLTPVLESAPQNPRIQQAQLFDLKAMPNPSASSFNVQVSSDNKNGKMRLRVMDLSGRIIQQVDNVSPGATLNIGANYFPGVYMVEVMQGDKSKRVKLVKL